MKSIRIYVEGGGETQERQAQIRNGLDELLKLAEGVVADLDALEGFYGKDFHRNKLPQRSNIEDDPKSQVYEKLKSASGDCRKGEYAKIKHASKLLALISAAKVAERCPRFKTFTAWLTARIEAA